MTDDLDLYLAGEREAKRERAFVREVAGLFGMRLPQAVPGQSLVPYDYRPGDRVIDFTPDPGRDGSTE